MSELYIPKQQSYVNLEFQPDFPQVDLSEDNADMLKFYLSREPGLYAQAEHLQHYQKSIYTLANQALKILQIETHYEPSELAAFSHGFASFEIINDLVHPPRIYDMNLARAQARRLFISPEDTFELELAHLIENNGNLPATPPSVLPTNAVEFELADRHAKWVEEYPHTNDVIVKFGEEREETIAQLHSRMIGAHFAFQLQHQDLDVTS